MVSLLRIEIQDWFRQVPTVGKEKIIMAKRSIGEIMAEGRKLTLEHSELLRKSIVGTLTAEEATRKAQLEGYLLGLMEQAQAQGVGVEAEAQDAVGSDDEYDADGYDEDGYNVDGMTREEVEAEQEEINARREQEENRLGYPYGFGGGFGY